MNFMLRSWLRGGTRTAPTASSIASGGPATTRTLMSGCLLLAEQAVGKQLTTVEGLPLADSLHRVQQAFIDHRAFQCAYCTPGFILGTVALLDRNPSPTDEEIVEALSASLCRCGSYRNILGAVQSLRSSQRRPTRTRLKGAHHAEPPGE